jgi:hypothetical protein
VAKDIKTDIEFVREIVRRALWSVSYHEEGIKKAYVEFGFAKELIMRGKFDIEAERVEYDENNDPVFKNLTQFALEIYDDKKNNIEHHEINLRNAYRDIAFIKTLLLRGNYTEIDIDQIQKELEARAQEKDE